MTDIAIIATIRGLAYPFSNNLSTMERTEPKGIGGELTGFVKRNGVGTIVVHAVELYFGWLFRSLPGPEGIWLRAMFYKLLFKHAGPKLLIYPGCYIIFSHRITAGKRVAINVGTYLDGRGGIVFGDNVMIGPRCVLSSCEHGFARTDVPMCQQPIAYAPITIEDDVLIGGNVCIKGSVTIHRGSIVGAGSVVTHDVPPYAVVGGVPARIIRNRMETDSVKLQETPSET
jgi:maltose O-acetyltransferase